MKLGELLNQLQTLMAANPRDITRDSEVWVSVGVLKGVVRQKLADETQRDLAVVYFTDETARLECDDKDGEQPWPVIIHGGADLEIPPIL